ncbi:MAG TPA: hypothetical protein VHC96_16235 [Puia sp.]|jgi:hypothetical protein|nr:hypothetical protein [Puia sp.]
MIRKSNSNQLHRYDHLIPPMKKALKFTARVTWFLMKTLVKTAFYLPTLMSRTQEHDTPASTPKPPRMPSPATAFPAP